MGVVYGMVYGIVYYMVYYMVLLMPSVSYCSVIYNTVHTAIYGKHLG